MSFWQCAVPLSSPISTNIDTSEPLPERLILSDVTKRYGRGPAVIDRLSHTFEPGHGTALVGPNGSGKTTLIRLITALSFPTSGSITYGTLRIHDEPATWLRKVGYVDDAGALPQYLNAIELLEWISRSRNTFDRFGREGLHELLDKVRLDERRENLIGTYSTGMTKKVHIAAALAGDPTVLILDEPFRGLDSETHQAIEYILAGFIREGGLLIMASHIEPSVERLCDAVLELAPRP